MNHKGYLLNRTTSTAKGVKSRCPKAQQKAGPTGMSGLNRRMSYLTLEIYRLPFSKEITSSTRWLLLVPSFMVTSLLLSLSPSTKICKALSGRQVPFLEPSLEGYNPAVIHESPRILECFSTLEFFLK